MLLNDYLGNVKTCTPHLTPSPHHITPLPSPHNNPIGLGSVTTLYLLRLMIYDQSVYNFEVLPRNVLSTNSDNSCTQNSFVQHVLIYKHHTVLYCRWYRH